MPKHVDSVRWSWDSAGSLAGSKAHSPSTVSVVSAISFILHTQGKLSLKSDPENKAQSLKSLSSIFGVKCCSQSSILALKD